LLLVILIELFKGEWIILGINAPPFAWVAAVGLPVFTFYQLAKLWCLVQRERRIHKDTMRRLKAIKTEHAVGRREGLSGPAYEAIAKAFEESPSLLPVWRRFDAQKVMRRGIDGDDQFWGSESAEGAFNDANLIEPRLNRNFFTAIPGIVTGVGLLVTFLAILVALLDVKIVDVGTVSKRVEGMETLIHGLSGKFVSSIAALLVATIFLLSEKKIFHRLAKSQLRLVEIIDDLVPRLSATRVLSDLQQDISEQSTAFRHFNADLSTKLRQGFNESMGPTIERMVRAIEDLNQMLRAAEAQRQDSLTDSLSELLRKLDQSITSTFGEMSTRFTESLSGSARQEFDEVINSLGGTARLLEGMNTQFQGTQLALNDLLNFAKNSTVEQMALGKSQVEELTAVLRGLMTQLHETAGSSVNTMTVALTAVVSDLSTKVTDLGQQLTSTMMESAGMATGAASTVVQQADNWARQSAEQLARLLERHESQLNQVQDLRAALDVTLGQFQGALSQYKAVTSDLDRVSRQVSAIATSATGAAKSMQDTSDSMQRLAGLAATQIDRLAEVNRSQEEIWQQIQGSMLQYQQVFGQVENTASDLLTQIGEHLNNYRGTVRQGYEELIKLSDEHIGSAVRLLGG